MSATAEQVGEVNGLRLLAIRGDSNYPSGGYSGLPVGSQGVVVPLGLSTGASDYICIWDPRTRKLRILTTLSGPSDVGLEVAAGTDLSGATFRVLTA